MQKQWTSNKRKRTPKALNNSDKMHVSGQDYVEESEKYLKERTNELYANSARNPWASVGVDRHEVWGPMPEWLQRYNGEIYLGSGQFVANGESPPFDVKDHLICTPSHSTGKQNRNRHYNAHVVSRKIVHYDPTEYMVFLRSV